MSRWPADAKRFRVSIAHNVRRDAGYLHIPNPALAKCGNPEWMQLVTQVDKPGHAPGLVATPGTYARSAPALFSKESR